MSQQAAIGTSDPTHAVGADARVLTPQAHGGALLTPWTAATRPNKRPGPSGGASIVQWCRTFITEPKYGGPKGFLRIAKRGRHGRTQAEQIAARRVLRARRIKWSRAGTPLAHADLEGLLDRDLGKPTQQIQIEATVQTIGEAESDLLAILRADVDLLPSICARIADQIPGVRAAILERLSPRLPAPEEPVDPAGGA